MLITPSIKKHQLDTNQLRHQLGTNHLPFGKLSYSFPLISSSIDSFRELSWLYQNFTPSIQGMYPNYTILKASLYKGCTMVSLWSNLRDFPHLVTLFLIFLHLSLALILIGNYHDCMKVLHEVYKVFTLIVQVHLSNYTRGVQDINSNHTSPFA